MDEDLSFRRIRYKMQWNWYCKRQSCDTLVATTAAWPCVSDCNVTVMVPRAICSPTFISEYKRL